MENTPGVEPAGGYRGGPSRVRLRRHRRGRHRRHPRRLHLQDLGRAAGRGPRDPGQHGRPRFIDTRNRPALAQTFEEVATGARLTVVVNHFKSKGSGCGAGDDDTTTGQGNCNGTRTLAAEALADWLATDPTGSGDEDLLIIGDLNSYAKEDPIAALQGAGYTDLVAEFGGPGATASCSTASSATSTTGCRTRRSPHRSQAPPSGTSTPTSRCSTTTTTSAAPARRRSRRNRTSSRCTRPTSSDRPITTRSWSGSISAGAPAPA